MTANCNKAINNIVTGHAYTMLGAFQYKNTKLIKVRNPWGIEKYTGPWSDNTPELKAALLDPAFEKHRSATGDGVFYMPIHLWR